MATFKLEKLRVGEVSIVDRAAIRRKFLILKNRGGYKMPNELIINCDEDMESILKSVAEAGKRRTDVLGQLLAADDKLAAIVKSILTEDVKYDAAIKKAGLSEKAVTAVKAALKALDGAKDEMPEDLLKKLSDIGGLKLPEGKKPEGDKKKPGEKKPEEEEEEMKKALADLGYVVEKAEDREEIPYSIKKNADGSPDFGDIPEASRGMVEMLWKQNEETAEQARKANEDLKLEKDARARKDFIAKASEFKHLTIEADKFGPILKSMKDGLSDDDYAEVERVLKAADEGLAEILLQKGVDGDTDGDTDTAYGKLENIAKSLVKDGRSKTFEQGFEKALDENPELAAQERAER